MGDTTFKLGAVLTLTDLISAPFAEITGNADKLKSKLAEIDGGVKQFESSMSKLKIGGGMMLAGAGVAKAISSTLEPAKTFQVEMAVLQGTAKATAEEMDLFSKAALKAGVDTKFSPDEAVKGLTALSSQGMNATQAVNMLIPSLDLASAAVGKLSIDDAAKVTAEVMNSFGIASEKAAGVTDVFTRMTQLSSFQFDQLGEAFRGVNAVASSANQSLEGTASVMMSLKAMGATATGAGEKFRMALQGLQTPSDGAANAISRLGFNTRDSSGAMRPMIDIFADMESAMEGMSIAEQDHYKKTILGVEGMTAYNAAMQATVEVMDNGVKKTLKGVEAVKYMENELKNSGGATAAFAEIQKSTWEGAQEMLSGTWTTIKLVFGQTFIPALTAATKAVTAILNPILAFMTANEGVRKAIAWTAAGAAGFLLFGGAVMVASGFMGLLKLTALANMSVMSKLAAVTKLQTIAQWALNTAFLGFPLVWIIGGIIALGAAVYGIVKYWDLIKEKAVGAWNWIKSVWGGAPDWVKGLIVVITTPISIPILLIYKHWGKIKIFASNVWNHVKMVFSAAGIYMYNSFIAPFVKVWGYLSGFFGSIWDYVYNAGAKIISTLWEGIKSKGAALKNGLKDIFGNVWGRLAPASDAKEGPFSKLTSSGRAVITTFNSGIEQEGNKTPAVLPYMKKSADILQDQSIVSNGSSPGGMNAAGGFVLNAGNLIGTLNLKGTSKSGNINELAQAMANLLYEQFLRAQNA